jgi:hypothetical protein
LAKLPPSSKRDEQTQSSVPSDLASKNNSWKPGATLKKLFPDNRTPTDKLTTSIPLHANGKKAPENVSSNATLTNGSKPPAKDGTPAQNPNPTVQTLSTIRTPILPQPPAYKPIPSATMNPLNMSQTATTTTTTTTTTNTTTAPVAKATSPNNTSTTTLNTAVETNDLIRPAKEPSQNSTKAQLPANNSSEPPNPPSSPIDTASELSSLNEIVFDKDNDSQNSSEDEDEEEQTSGTSACDDILILANDQVTKLAMQSMDLTSQIIKLSQKNNDAGELQKLKQANKKLRAFLKEEETKREEMVAELTQLQHENHNLKTSLGKIKESLQTCEAKNTEFEEKLKVEEQFRSAFVALNRQFNQSS